MSAKVSIELQNEECFSTVPPFKLIQKWAELSYQGNKDTSICVRVVDTEEGKQLNEVYRGKAYATNVLSFPFEAPPIPIETQTEDTYYTYLGDIVLCEPVVQREAKQQQKNNTQHWAHLIVHGVLHLQGYDHITEEDAYIMETLEIALLKKIGFSNPYTTHRHNDTTRNKQKT